MFRLRCTENTGLHEHLLSIFNKLFNFIQFISIGAIKPFNLVNMWFVLHRSVQISNNVNYIKFACCLLGCIQFMFFRSKCKYNWFLYSILLISLQPWSWINTYHLCTMFTVFWFNLIPCQIFSMFYWKFLAVSSTRATFSYKNSRTNPIYDNRRGDKGFPIINPSNNSSSKSGNPHCLSPLFGKRQNLI